MGRRWSLVIYTVAGWAISAATMSVGSRLAPLDTALWIHAVLAPITAGLLAWLYFARFPEAPPGRTSLTMLAIVVGLDGLVVAPLFDRSYAIFRSALRTWVPFASVLLASYLVGRAMRARSRGAGAR